MIVAALLTPLAAFSGAFSLAVALDTSEPTLSLGLYGDLPEAKIRISDLAIAAAVAERGAQSAQTPAKGSSASALVARLQPAQRMEIEARALSAVKDTPFAPGALRQLAFIEPDPARRQRLLELSIRSSRRDVLAAAQIAELQLRDGAVQEGLATLDTALSVSDQLDARIFPLMLGAARDAQFASILRRRLSLDPEWGERMAQHAVTDTGSAIMFARMADAFPQGSQARSVDYGAPLIDRLASELQPSAAFAAYVAYSQGDQNVSAFGKGDLTPLDWRLIDNLETGTRLVGTAVELFAAPRRKGEVARIMMPLPPGRYALNLTLADPRGSGGMIVLTRACLTDGAELTSAQTSTSLDTVLASLAFEVPEGCPYQSLRLGVSAGGEAASVLIDDVALETITPGGAP